MFIYKYLYLYLYIYAASKRNTEAQTIFSLSVCPFVYEETNGDYLFANGLNDLPIYGNMSSS
jgi:hypothetical protein